jgi:dihydroxyacetone kinase
MTNVLLTVVYRKLPHGHDKVILLSGGGSGHEHAHTGCVGEGMLDVAGHGNIFASPSAPQVLRGLRVLEAPRGYEQMAPGTVCSNC